MLKTREDDEQAKELMELIENEYDAEIQVFPAVNVVTQRGAEFVADKMGMDRVAIIWGFQKVHMRFLP